MNTEPYLSKQIHNLIEDGVDTGIERYIDIWAVNTNARYKQIFVDYEIRYVKDGVNISKKYQTKNPDFDWYVYNTTPVAVRDLETMERVLKDEYLNMEVPEGETKREPTDDDYVKGPGHDVCFEIFKHHQALPYPVLEEFILANAADGKFDIEV